MIVTMSIKPKSSKKALLNIKIERNRSRSKFIELSRPTRRLLPWNSPFHIEI
jgi:hypothetical protein